MWSALHLVLRLRGGMQIFVRTRVRMLARTRRLKHTLTRSHSFAMSGCGWLTPFHLGVVKELIESGCVTQDTVAAGTSGGALGAMTMVSGIRPEDALEALIDFGKKPELQSDIEKNMAKIMRSLLSEVDKRGEAGSALRNCNGRLFVCVTRLWPETSIKPILISEYKSIDFLIDIVGASCFIPGWSAPKLYTTIADKDHTKEKMTAFVDGGFLAFMPPVGDVRISPFPKQFILHSRSKPTICLPIGAYSFPRLLSWVLRPAPEAVLNELYIHGREAARDWVTTDKKNTRI